MSTASGVVVPFADAGLVCPKSACGNRPQGTEQFPYPGQQIRVIGTGDSAPAVPVDLCLWVRAFVRHALQDTGTPVQAFLIQIPCYPRDAYATQTHPPPHK